MKISSKGLWTVLAVVSVLATLLFIYGLAYGTRDIIYPHKPDASSAVTGKEPGNQTEQTGGKGIKIVALGDSLTRGTGDESGKGYVGNVKELLGKSLKQKVNVIGNLSVNGYQSNQLLRDVQQKESVRSTIAKANVILFTIGGNDLFHLGSEEVDPVTTRSRIPDAMKRLKGIVDELVKLNPEARIVYIGLYNPFLEMDGDGAISLVVQDWNRQIAASAVKYKHVTVVPVSDLFENDGKRYLYSDLYHPNDKGYKRIAERIVQDLE